MKKFIKKILGVGATCNYIRVKMKRAAVKRTAREVLQHALEHVELNGGLFLEFGVYSGDTINYISSLAGQTVFGFDSFEGLPEFWRKGYNKGTFKMDSLPRVNKNVVLIEGWFHETLPGFMNQQTEKIAFMHIDCDLYSSTKTIFENVKHGIVPGTVIVFDEYFNYPGWQHGEFKAFKEFVTANNISYEYLAYNTNHEQVAVKIK